MKENRKIFLKRKFIP